MYADGGGTYLKPCAKCKAGRKGVNYCIRMGHAPQAEAEVDDIVEGGVEVKEAGTEGRVGNEGGISRVRPATTRVSRCMVFAAHC